MTIIGECVFDEVEKWGGKEIKEPQEWKLYAQPLCHFNI